MWRRKPLGLQALRWGLVTIVAELPEFAGVTA